MRAGTNGARLERDGSDAILPRSAQGSHRPAFQLEQPATPGTARFCLIAGDEYVHGCLVNTFHQARSSARRATPRAGVAA